MKLTIEMIPEIEISGADLKKNINYEQPKLNNRR